MTTAHMLKRALADARAYRACLHAALDQLHEAQRTIARQREQIQEMRDERERYAMRIFDAE